MVTRPHSQLELFFVKFVIAKSSLIGSCGVVQVPPICLCAIANIANVVASTRRFVVGARVKMAARTVRLGQVCPAMLLVCKLLKVVWVYAVSRLAGVVNIVALQQRPDKHLVRVTMGLQSVAKVCVALFVKLACPQPAAGRGIKLEVVEKADFRWSFIAWHREEKNPTRPQKVNPALDEPQSESRLEKRLSSFSRFKAGEIMLNACC